MKLLSAFAVALFGLTSSAQANKSVSFLLNWVAGGDRGAYYYAQKMGWYKDAGIDLTLLQGKGSMVAAQAAGAGGTLSCSPIRRRFWSRSAKAPMKSQ